MYSLFDFQSLWLHNIITLFPNLVISDSVYAVRATCHGLRGNRKWEESTVNKVFL